MSAPDDPRPLVAHVVYRFDVGGLENGIVNLINHMPRGACRHVVIALTGITDFRRRIARDDVEFIALDKPAGHAQWIYPQLYRLFRRLRPAIVHSRNLAALEVVIPAWAAGVQGRIHGEHGRDDGDLEGFSREYQWVRRIYRPFVTYFIALSRDLEHYLSVMVCLGLDRQVQIYNGVDAPRFRPGDGREPIPGCPFADDAHWSVRSGACTRSRTRRRCSNGSAMRAAAIWRGCPANATTSRRYCADSTASCCLRCPRASRTRSSRRWPAASRSSPRRPGATANWSSRGAADAWLWSATSTAWRAVSSPTPTIGGGLAPRGQRGARVESEFSLAAMVRRYQELYDRLLSEPKAPRAVRRRQSA